MDIYRLKGCDFQTTFSAYVNCITDYRLDDESRRKEAANDGDVADREA